MSNWKETIFWIFPPYFIAIYFFGLTGFFWMTITIVIILLVNFYKNSITPTKQVSEHKKTQKDEIQIVEYSDLVVTRISTRKKKKWEKKMAQYSKLDRKLK